MFPLLKDEDFQRLHFDNHAPESKWAASSDYEFNTNLVHVFRTPSIYSEPILIHELVFRLAWKDYLPHAERINAAMMFQQH